ncbi:hypothetical protein ABZ769_36565 [Streptomyces olivoreticuli]
MKQDRRKPVRRLINVAAPPPCWTGGLAWIPRQAERVLPDAVLTVQMNYGPKKGSYRLPGGYAGHLEPDWLAMGRHLRHEIGRVPRMVRLLGTDYVPPDPTTGAAMGRAFIYLCEPLPADTEIVLPEAEPGMEASARGHLDREKATSTGPAAGVIFS